MMDVTNSHQQIRRCKIILNEDVLVATSDGSENRDVDGIKCK